MPSAFLTDSEIVKYINEITTGLRPVKVRKNGGKREADVTIMLRQPFGEEKRIAQLHYDNAFAQAKEDGFRTKEQIQKDFIEHYEIYTELDKTKERSLKGDVDALKLMYKTALTPQYKASYKDKIYDAENKYYEFISKKTAYEKFSVETISDMARLKYLVFCCSLDIYTLKSMWSNYEKYQDERDFVLVSDLINHLGIFILGYTSDVLRAIARSHQWRSIWNVSSKTQATLFGMPIGVQRTGNNPFTSPVADWSNAQLQLCGWSIFYDNLMQSSEPPPRQVMEDDDLCDKYVENQIEKQEKERFKSIGPKGSGHGGETDIFILGDEKTFLFTDEGELRK
jgi:hypothetical protein